MKVVANPMRGISKFAYLAVLSLAIFSCSLAAQNTVQTFAGGGPNGLTPMKSTLGAPTAISRDGSGNLYFFDYDTQRVLKEDTGGTVTVVAGSGVCYTFWSSGPFSEPFSCEQFGETGVPQFGDGGPALGAQFRAWTGMAADLSGNIYIASGCVVRKVDTTGMVNTVAGNGQCGYGGDGGPSTSAMLDYPQGLFVDSSGNIFIADTSNSRVREVLASNGTITTVAGNGTSGYSGDGGLATNAMLSGPVGVFVNASGNLYISDDLDMVVRQVVASTGNIFTVAGNAKLGSGYSGDGGPATSAQLCPYGIFVDASGDIFISDVANAVVREVSGATGDISTVAGNFSLGRGFSGDGGPATSAQLDLPWGLVLDDSGNIFIADEGEHVIREVSGGNISTVTGLYLLSTPTQMIGLPYRGGEGSLATEAPLGYPYGMAEDVAGNIFVADKLGNDVREISAATGVVTTIAGNGLNGHTGDGGPAVYAELSYPQGVAVDIAGNVYIADSENCAVREVDASSGNIQTIAGTNHTCGFSGDGQAATAAHLGILGSLALDSSGNLFIADLGNNRVREVTAADGIIHTVAGGGSSVPGDGGPATAAQLGHPWSVIPDSSGNLYVADADDCVVREVTATNGNIQTIAGTFGVCGYTGDGGPATSAQLGWMASTLLLDAAGNLFVPDPTNAVVREVSAADGTISTVAGSGTAGYSGDGGPALSAEFFSPTAAATDLAGDLLIADGLRIRSVAGLVTVTPPPQATVSSSALGFPAEPVGTASASQTVTIANSGKVSLTVSSVAVVGPFQADFLESDNCAGKTLAAGATCTASISFTPSAPTDELATLIVTDSAGTQKVDLFGLGMDFSTSAASGGSTSATVSQGQTATYSLQFTALANLPARTSPRPAMMVIPTVSITLSCSGMPVQATCSVPPQPVVVALGTSTNVTVSVTTAAPSRTAALAVINSRGASGRLAAFLVTPFLCSVFVLGLVAPVPRRRRIVGSVCSLGLALVLGGCGSSRPVPVPSGGTPVGNYTLTLTATAGNDTHTTQLSLTVTK